MQTVRLSRRLEAIAALLPADGGLADVGTDHGLIPVTALLRGFQGRVCATDIRPGPLDAARRTACEASLADRIEFLLADGLDGLDGTGLGTVVIAGMGGENIADILERAPWTREGRLLVLQPMSKADVLRSFLSAHGYCVVSERLVEDGPVYELLTACGGKEEALSPAELLTGRFALIKGDPLFPARLDRLIASAQRAAAGLARSAKPGDGARLAEEKITLASLLEMRERMEKHD